MFVYKCFGGIITDVCFVLRVDASACEASDLPVTHPPQILRTATMANNTNYREFHYMMRTMGPAACRSPDDFIEVAKETLRVDIGVPPRRGPFPQCSVSALWWEDYPTRSLDPPAGTQSTNLAGWRWLEPESLPCDSSTPERQPRLAPPRPRPSLSLWTLNIRPTDSSGRHGGPALAVSRTN